jgi:hypothetical protein
MCLRRVKPVSGEDMSTVYGQEHVKHAPEKPPARGMRYLSSGSQPRADNAKGNESNRVQQNVDSRPSTPPILTLAWIRASPLVARSGMNTDPVTPATINASTNGPTARSRPWLGEDG